MGESNLEDLVSSPTFQAMRKLNLVNEVELRNLKIRTEYQKLRCRLTSTHSITKLMEKYSLSDAALISILFRKKNYTSPIVYKP